MKRKLLLALVIFIGAAFCVGGFFVYKFVVKNDVDTTIAEKENVDDEIEETKINTVYKTLNLYINGKDYPLHDLIINKNYKVNFTNNNIVEVFENKSIIPLNPGQTVATFLNSNGDVLVEYKINVWSEIEFFHHQSETIFIGDSCSFGYEANYDFTLLDIETNITNDNISLAEPLFENDNKKMTIVFSFKEFNKSKETVEINTTFTFDNYQLALAKNLEYNVYKQTTNYTVTYSDINDNPINNFKNLSIINNSYYNDIAFNDGCYTSIILTIESEASTKFKIEIENETPNIVDVILNHKLITTETTTLNQFVIESKQVEGTAKIKISDCYSSYILELEIPVRKVYATDYIFSLKENAEYLLNDVFAVEIEKIEPMYGFVKDFSVFSYDNNVSIMEHIINFDHVGDCEIFISVDDMVIKSYSIKIVEQSSYNCKLISSSPTIVIDNELKTINISNGNVDDYLSLNISIKQNNTFIDKNNVYFIYDTNCIELSYKDYPTILIKLKTLDLNSSLLIKFNDISVTYTLSIS